MVMLAVVLWMSMALAAVTVMPPLALGVPRYRWLHAASCRVLHRVLAVFGFATSEEADAVFHGPGGVALAQQVGV